MEISSNVHYLSVCIFLRAKKGIKLLKVLDFHFYNLSVEYRLCHFMSCRIQNSLMAQQMEVF